MKARDRGRNCSRRRGDATPAVPPIQSRRPWRTLRFDRYQHSARLDHNWRRDVISKTIWDARRVTSSPETEDCGRILQNRMRYLREGYRANYRARFLTIQPVSHAAA